jgi:hypothetical protein
MAFEILSPPRGVRSSRAPRETLKKRIEKRPSGARGLQVKSASDWDGAWPALLRGAWRNEGEHFTALKKFAARNAGGIRPKILPQENPGYLAFNKSTGTLKR